MKYRFAGKEKLLAIGVYPEISLKQAREKREEAKQLLSEGSTPASIKKPVNTLESMTALNMSPMNGTAKINPSGQKTTATEY